MKNQITVAGISEAERLAGQGRERAARRARILARRVPRGDKLMRPSVRTARKALTAFHVEANRIAQVICDVQGGRIWPEGAPWAMGSKSKIVKLSSTAEDRSRITELIAARKAVCACEPISLSGLVRGPTSTTPRATRAHCAWRIPDLSEGRGEARKRATLAAKRERPRLTFRQCVAEGRAYAAALDSEADEGLADPTRENMERMARGTSTTGDAT